MDLPAPSSLAMPSGVRSHHMLPPWPWPWLRTVIKSKVQGKCLHCVSLWRVEGLAALLVTRMI